jgi:hypothetical protein
MNSEETGLAVMEIVAKTASILLLFQIVTETILYIRDPKLDLDDSLAIRRFYVVWLIIRLGAALLITLYLFLKD